MRYSIIKPHARKLKIQSIIFYYFMRLSMTHKRSMDNFNIVHSKFCAETFYKLLGMMTI